MLSLTVLINSCYIWRGTVEKKKCLTFLQSKSSVTQYSCSATHWFKRKLHFICRESRRGWRRISRSRSSSTYSILTPSCSTSCRPLLAEAITHLLAPALCSCIVQTAFRKKVYEEAKVIRQSASPGAEALNVMCTVEIREGSLTISNEITFELTNLRLVNLRFQPLFRTSRTNYPSWAAIFHFWDALFGQL